MKHLLPPPKSRSRSVKSITPAASSVFQKSSRCDTNGPNSPSPQVYNPGRLSSSSWSLDCATPRTEGPSEPTRPKHILQSINPYSIVPRFPSINRFRSLSLRRLLDNSYTSSPPPPHPCFASSYTHHVRLSVNFLDLQRYPPTYSIVCTNRQPHAPTINITTHCSLNPSSQTS